VILCEYCIENFNARGSDDYFHWFSARLDEFFEAGWTLLEADRDPVRGGWWRVYLFRE
jgi:hypothetical protein